MSDADPTVAYAGTVTGRVQGVAFRYLARRTAIALRVNGWIRNLRDGSVEFHAEGAAQPVADFMKWLGQGPPAARVDAVHAKPVASRAYEAFEIR